MATPPPDNRSTPTQASPCTPPPFTSLPTPRSAQQKRRRDREADEPLPGSPPSPVQMSPQSQSVHGHSESIDDEDSPLSEFQLAQMQSTFESIATTMGKEPKGDIATLAEMCQTLLVDCRRSLFLRQQVAAQQATIATLQQQALLAKQLVDIERERFTSERASWQAEAQAMMRLREAEIMSGNRPKRVLDLDVGYHQELEAANKRLEMDNRLMAPRLVDTQRQIESLVNELRHLRPHVILDTTVFERNEDDLMNNKPTSVSQTSPRFGAHEIKPKRAVMGDARAEHLLLAAKKVRSMRRKDGNIGHLTLSELQRRGIVGPEGGLGYSEGYNGDAEVDELVRSEEEDTKNISASPTVERQPSSSAKVATPLLNRAKKQKRPPATPSRNRSTPQVAQTTPGGNFNDLLLAAEMATRPGTPTREQGPISVMSATRSTSTRAHSTIESPLKKPRHTSPATVEWAVRPRGGDDVVSREEPHSASALDLLAQASQDVAQSSQGSSVLASAARFGGMMEGEGYRSRSPSRREETPLGPAIKLEGTPTATPRPTPRPTPRSAQREDSRQARSSAGATPSRGFPSSSGVDDVFSEGSAADYQSPGGATVPGIGKYVHLSSNLPQRRVRSPYLKWTKEEDELLTRAVMQHGEKWDQVSKCVPTRSYHQVRQRWLRKTGAFDKKPTGQTPTNEPSPLGRATVPGEQASPTPKGRKRKEL